MELQYPINLIGIEDGAKSGDVLTRYGEVLGRWELLQTTHLGGGPEAGELSFIAHGEEAPKFSQGIPSLESGLLFGKAMSLLCIAVREWHEQTEEDFGKG